MNRQKSLPQTAVVKEMVPQVNYVWSLLHCVLY